MKKKTEQK